MPKKVKIFGVAVVVSVAILYGLNWSNQRRERAYNYLHTPIGNNYPKTPQQWDQHFDRTLDNMQTERTSNNQLTFWAILLIITWVVAFVVAKQESETQGNQINNL